MEKLFKQFEVVDGINYTNWFFAFFLLIIFTKVFEFLFKRYSLTTSNADLFASNFLFFSISIFLIISTIKSSLALSLGLVGALSIIRFRTAIKEPEQIVYLLGLTGLSISLAAEQIVISFTCIVVFAIASIFRKRQYNKSSTLITDYLLINFTSEDVANVNNLINALSKISEIQSLINFDNFDEKNYRLLFKIQNANTKTLDSVYLVFKESSVTFKSLKLSSSHN
jgi:hypothetical protein